MEHGIDLSRQGLTSLAEVPRGVVRHVERNTVPFALSLAQNRLTQLHEIHAFAHVVQLDLSGNQLQSLDGIDALTHLESLNAARNSLTSLDGLMSLAHLRVLTVAGNKLEQLDALRSLKSLAAIDASYNCIVKWPQFGHLAKLESIDLSSNQLEAFPVSVAARMFPPSLRRLSLAKNQIQELCGIAALGMFLQNLQTIKVDGNPATQRVLRDGGCLDFLWINLFASVAFTQGAGVRRDDFEVPLEVVDAVEDAVERGDEATLIQFVLTGTVPTPSIAMAQPPMRPPIREDPPSIERIKTNESPRRSSTPVAGPVPIATDGLSKESKMEMWKRMMDERKAQEQRDRAAVAVRDAQPTTVPPPPPIVLPTKPISISEAKPFVQEAPAISTSAPAVDGQFKHLTDQLAGMRKYVNVWIKREQLTRITAAKRIQKAIRHRQWLRHISKLVHQSRVRRQHEYGVTPCSSFRFLEMTASHNRHLHLCAIEIQRHLRGWLVRFRISRWLYYSDGAVRIQRTWRHRRKAILLIKRELGLATPHTHSFTSNTLVRVVSALARDVRQLQRVFVVQEQVLAHQWRELARNKRLVEMAWTPAVVKIQSLWRGYDLRRKLELPSRPRKDPILSNMERSRDEEIVALRAELEALKQVVQQLVDKK